MSRARFMTLAAEAKIEVDYTAGRKRHPRTGEPVAYELTLDAPAGQLFISSGCHSDCSLMGQPGQTSPDWRCLRVELRCILALGFVPCRDVDCEICHAEEVASS